MKRNLVVVFQFHGEVVSIVAEFMCNAFYQIIIYNSFITDVRIITCCNIIYIFN